MVKIGVGEGAGSSFCLPGSSSDRTDSSNSLCALDRKQNRLVFKDLQDASRTVLRRNAGNHLLAALQELREDRNLCDVVFKVRMTEDGEGER